MIGVMTLPNRPILSFTRVISVRGDNKGEYGDDGAIKMM